MFASLRAPLFLRRALPATRYIRSFASSAKVERKRITLIPGDGIGPEITSSVLGVFQAAQVPVDWEVFDVHQGTESGKQVGQDVIASISRNHAALKGPWFTNSGIGAPSRNTELRKALDLYAHVIRCKSTPGIKTRHDDVPIDMIIVRENTQGEYTGLEQTLTPGVVQSLKVVTREASERIARFAFELAQNEGRKKVTAIHKANIQKQTDGLFLEVCRQIAKEYPHIQFNDMIIDNCCMQLVMKPQQFDVMVTPNLYGNLVTNVGAALVGGPGVCPGVSSGMRGAVYEMGAHHVAADIAGQDKANPTGLLFSSAYMLRSLGMDEYANKIESAVRSVISEGKTRTADIGGASGTKAFTQAVIEKVEGLNA